ncbi:MAG: IMP dehydrogenase [Deltaproteobacteria bacterium]|nr:IMP dehydrogenase [Deltaproteobacteria bacterium]
MARNISAQPSRALAEFRLLPRLTTPDTVPAKIDLRTPLVTCFQSGRTLRLGIPIVSAAMQAVSGSEMGIAMAMQGGAAFLFCSQTVASQAEMVRAIKRHKAGFVEPRTVPPDMILREVFALSKKHGFSVFPVVDAERKLLGLIRRDDYDLTRHGHLPAQERMVPRARLDVGVEITQLEEANELLLEGHHSVLPVVDKKGRLLSLVFKKDIHEHVENPLQVHDEKKRLLAVAAINTHDYEQRVPALVEAGVDALAVDSSDGYSFYQRQVLEWIGQRHPGLPVVGGNIVTAAGFDYLVAAGAGAIKVGMGGGTICITQEQKGTGRGLATAILDVVEARDRHFEKTGRYVPVIADGGVVTAKDVVIALALGADSVMMGRYFARMDESPAEKVVVNGRLMKAYWGEGSARAREWKAARYGQAAFVEGVEGLVDYAGKLADNLPETLAMVRSSMASCGVADIGDLHHNAEMELVSALSIREGQVHDVVLPRGASADDSPRSWGD